MKRGEIRWAEHPDWPRRLTGGSKIPPASHAGGSVSHVLLRCTTRLLKLLGSRRASVLQNAEPGGDDWYANVFIVERRKCLLLVHSDTLFPVLDTDIRVAQLDDVGLYVTTLIVDALSSEGLSGTVLGPTDPSSVQVAKTASRSVLGHMNEMTFEAQHLIAYDGGLQHADIDTVNRRLRRGLHGRGGDYVVPLELAAARSA